MRTITTRANTLLLALRYNYTPVSTYEVQNKPNPVISITLSHQSQAYKLQFRVHASLGSSSRTSYPELPKTSRGCSWALLTTMAEVCLSSGAKSTASCLGHTSNWVTWKVVTAQSSAPISVMNLSSCLTTGLDY